MDMNIEKDEIFIKVKGIGFVFLLDKRMKHNLISPAFFAFFDFGKRPMYSLPESNIREVNTKPVYDHLQPFLSEYVNSISTNDVFHYVGKKVGLCKDNKLKKCKAVKFKFEYEGCPYTMLFFVDKGPVGQQICGIINGKL